MTRFSVQCFFPILLFMRPRVFLCLFVFKTDHIPFLPNTVDPCQRTLRIPLTGDGSSIDSKKDSPWGPGNAEGGTGGSRSGERYTLLFLPEIADRQICCGKQKGKGGLIGGPSDFPDWIFRLNRKIAGQLHASGKRSPVHRHFRISAGAGNFHCDPPVSQRKIPQNHSSGVFRRTIPQTSAVTENTGDSAAESFQCCGCGKSCRLSVFFIF